MGHVCPFLETGRHINHMASNETQMSWLAYSLQNYSTFFPNFSLLLNKHVKPQMRRIWMLDTAVIPDTSVMSGGECALQSFHVMRLKW